MIRNGNRLRAIRAIRKRLDIELKEAMTLANDFYNSIIARVASSPVEMASTFELQIIIRLDGSDYCAHFGNFINLQESPAGFGKTRLQALLKLLADNPLP